MSYSYNSILWLFCCSNCFTFDHWKLFQVGSCALHLFFKYLLIFWHHKILHTQVIYFFFCHKSGINHFSRESWFHCWRMVFRNQSLDTGCVHCYGDVIVSRSFQRTLLGNLCMPIRVYTYTCIYFCFCLPVFIF